MPVIWQSLSSTARAGPVRTTSGAPKPARWPQFRQGFGHEGPVAGGGVGLCPSLGVGDEQGQDPAAPCRRLGQHGIIVYPQIALEPNKNILTHGRSDSSHAAAVKGPGLQRAPRAPSLSAQATPQEP